MSCVFVSRVGTLLPVLCLIALPAPGQRDHAGLVRGRVVDAEDLQPLAGATVVLEPSGRGTATNIAGQFEIAGVAVGIYRLRVSYVGYGATYRSDVVVRVGRATLVEIALRPATIETEAVVVSVDFFDDTTYPSSSIQGLVAEEVRRAPGAAGDVSRVLGSLPSIAKVDDTRNGLVVRGGSPLENGFYIDGIRIPNINHFPTQGSTGGAIGLINVDFIDHIRFHAGGFSVGYGDRLSSITELWFRAGNRERFETQLDVNLGGAGFVAEGPAGKIGSFLVGARRSYLDLIVNAFLADEADAVPTYSDAHTKLVLDLTPAHRVTVIDILGVDRSGIDRDEARKQNENTFGSADFTVNTAGANWRYLWGSKGYSNTSLSHSVSRYAIDFRETRTGEPFLDNASLESTVLLRNENHFHPGRTHGLELGVEAEWRYADYDVLYADPIDPIGQPLDDLTVDRAIGTVRLGAFVGWRYRPHRTVSLTPGVRVDYRGYTSSVDVSPRFSARWTPAGGATVTAAVGVFTQALPLALLAQRDAYRNLRAPRAIHAVVGMQYLFRQDTRFTVEAYSKEYDRFPLDPSQPSLFPIDQLFYHVQPLALIMSSERLVDRGRARTRGLEVTLQKKLARKLYGLVGGSYFRSSYRGDDGVWRDRVFDNRVVFTVAGGFKPGYSHEVSVKWVYAGGRPFTPLDEERSTALNAGVFDIRRVNAARLPGYHSLSVRYDRRFHIRETTLLAYLSIWNAYDRRNVSNYYWDENTASIREVRQFGLLPIVGIEYEF